MADLAPAPAAAIVSSVARKSAPSNPQLAKEPMALKAKKPVSKPTHPPTAQLVNEAIKTLKERGGSSLQANKKYIGANNKVDAEKLAPFIKKYLKNAVVKGDLIQTKGKGASGSFKLSAAALKQKVENKKKNPVSSAVRANKRDHQSLGKCLELPIKGNRKTIVDVNYDCLERVFGFLEICDLVNLAEANTYLKVAAKMAFVQRLNRRLLIVGNAKKCSDIFYSDDAIYIRNILLAAKVIRLFGEKIVRIEILYMDDSHYKHFFVHINEYCHKTLNSLNIVEVNLNIFSAAKHPFGNVEKFSSLYAIAGPESEQFNRLFPRLRQLIFKYSFFMNGNFISQTFPSLDSLILYNCNFPSNYNANYITCSINDLKRVVTLNPQLQSFALVGYENPRIWEFIHSELKNLKTISTSFSARRAEYFEGPPIELYNIETFEVNCKFKLFETNSTTSGTYKLIDVFSFKRLKKISVECHVSDLGMWLDLVLAHPTIEELEIWILNDVFDFGNSASSELHRKLNKVSKNTKLVTLGSKRVDRRSFYNEELLNFFEVHQWFSKLSLVFDFSRDPCQNIHDMELLYKDIPQMKNYKIKKYIEFHETRVVFEKCE